MSVDEFARLHDDDQRHELDQGEVLTMPPTSDEHADVTAEITARLRPFAKQHGLGAVWAGDPGFVLAEGTVRAPDVAFVRKDRVTRKGAFFRGAPDLALEVFSATDSVPQLMRKVQQYLRAGTQTVWVVYPETRQVHVLERSGSDRLLGAGDLLEAPGLLPGFCVRAGELFE